MMCGGCSYEHRKSVLLEISQKHTNVILATPNIFVLPYFHIFVSNNHEELKMNFPFSIYKSHCLSKIYFNTVYRKCYGEITTIHKDHFSKRPIAILSLTITHYIATNLEHQFNLSYSLVLLEKDAYLQCPNLQFNV